jgi:hypothetical protein
MIFAAQHGFATAASLSPQFRSKPPQTLAMLAEGQ